MSGNINAKFNFFRLFLFSCGLSRRSDGGFDVTKTILEFLDRGDDEPHVTLKSDAWLHFTAERERAKREGREAFREGLASFTPEHAEQLNAWGNGLVREFVRTHVPVDFDALEDGGYRIVGIPYEAVEKWMRAQAEQSNTLFVDMSVLLELAQKIVDTAARPRTFLGVRPNVFLRLLAIREGDDGEIEIMPVNYYPSGIGAPPATPDAKPTPLLESGWYSHKMELVEKASVEKLVPREKAAEAFATLQGGLDRYPREGNVKNPPAERPPVLQLVYYYNADLRQLWFNTVLDHYGQK